MYNPFQNYKQGSAGLATLSQSSSRISAAKIKNLNNTVIGHIRSFSNCSKKGGELSSKRSGVSYTQSKVAVANSTINVQNTISEA